MNALLEPSVSEEISEDELPLEAYIDPEILEIPVIQRILAKVQGKPFFVGRNRVAIMLKRHVLKIPMNFNGFTDNDWEGSVSNGEISFNNPDYIQYPHTRLYFIDDVPLVFMEKVRHASNQEVEKYLGIEEGESNWTWSVDGGQAGFNHRGRLVAYDYGPR